MALTPEQKRERQIQKAKEARERQKKKKLAQSKDPAYIAKKRERQQLANERARDKQLKKLNDPNYIAEQKKKQRLAVERANKRKAVKAAKAKEVKQSKSGTKKTSRGLKGRNPTAEEKRLQDLIGKLPCIACKKQGRHNPVISLHHVDGRTKPWAHAKSLPLCAYHHDTPLPVVQSAVYPNVYPVHAKGSFGGKAAFEREYGTQDELLAEVYEEIGELRPWE